jgi:hypothetical protein
MNDFKILHDASQQHPTLEENQRLQLQKLIRRKNILLMRLFHQLIV